MGGKTAAAAEEERSEDCRSPGPRAVAPCLLKQYFTGEGSNINHAFYNICEPNYETSEKFIPELNWTTFYQKPSHQGWLIILCDDKGDNEYYTPSGNYGDCFLWNPMTNERIQLPTILEFCNGGYRFIDCVLTSPPRNNAKPDNNNNDSMVFIFGVYHDQVDDNSDYSFLFCLPGETQWRIHKFSDQDIKDIIVNSAINSVLCFKGKLYLMSTDADYQDDHLDHYLKVEYFTKDKDLIISAKSFHVKEEILFPLVGEGKSAYQESHYVESHDEIFRVDMIYRRGEVTSIEVVRLNFSLMEWQKVSNLGDYVLFVGSQTTACCLAADLGFTKGCLYYLLFIDKRLHKFETESTCDTITLPCIGPTEPYSCSDWVIMPVNMQARADNMLGSIDGENGSSNALEIGTSTLVAKYENKEVEVAHYWNNLNKDNVEVIANYLHGSDYKHFRSVCKENRTIIPIVQTTSFLSPWLVFSKDLNDTIFNIVNPMYNDENYFINLLDLAGSTIRFQKGGWLLMTRKHNIFFYNPFTREKVKLPDMDKAYCYSVVSFSSLPNCSDCTVFAMDERTDKVYIDFISQGEPHWSSRIFNAARHFEFLNTAVFHDGAFFCVNYHGSVGVFSASHNNWKVVEKPCALYSNLQGFLVECAEDLLLVKLGYLKTTVTIFKLHFSDMKWVKVESLGEHMLFVSDTSCVSAVAPNSYMKNKIYYPRLHLNGGGIVFYSLETSSFHSLGNQQFVEDFNDTKGWFSNCTWIVPNMSKSTLPELDWIGKPF